MPQASCHVLSCPDRDGYGSEADQIQSYVGTGEQAGDWLYRQDVAQRATIRMQTANQE
jgi:hypothetical protein